MSLAAKSVAQTSSPLLVTDILLYAFVNRTRNSITFEKVLDELRHKLALHYLNEKNVPVNQTAYLVGFSEPAAFSRAFKRWTGSSPRIYVSRSESST